MKNIITVKHPKFTAKFAKKGGQLLSYIFDDHEDLLYLSEKAEIEGGKAIRGGIPICWPWFGSSKDGGPSHGFARNNLWEFEATQSTGDQISLSTIFYPKGNQLYKGLRLEAKYTFDKNLPKLKIALKTINHSKKAIKITQALHTYFHVGSIEDVVITGLENETYFNKLDKTTNVQKGKIRFAKETDNVYYSRGKICLTDYKLNRKIKIEHDNSNSVVVWNPWNSKEATIGDMTKGDYKSMCCIEAANVQDDHIILSPNQEHSLKAIYTLLPL